MNYHLKVVNITKEFFLNFVKRINISGIDGDLGIYPGHAKLLTLIRPGLLLIVDKLNVTKYFYISGGILEIQPFNVTILADNIISSLNLNKDDIIIEKKIAEENIKKYINNNIMINKFKNKLTKAIAKLHVLKRSKI